MTVVLPYGGRDGDLVLALLEHMDWLGPLAAHQCHVIHQPDGLPWRERIIAAATRTFGRVSAESLDTDTPGWPQAGNALFSAAARAMSSTHWYFFEPDCTPLRVGWLDALEEELRASGKACLGAVVPTRYVNRETGEEVLIGDMHMVGAGIYPPNVPSGSLLFKSLLRCGQPWDLFMQHELTPYCHASESIQHIWNVRNCRRENGQILCDAGSPLSRPEPIREDALVVHGIKDGSLLRLLQAEAKIELPVPVPAEFKDDPLASESLGTDEAREGTNRTPDAEEVSDSRGGQTSPRPRRGRAIARDPKIMRRLAAEAAVAYV